MSWAPGAGHTSRTGLSTRQRDGQVQISIGNQFDFDNEVDDLRAGVSRIKDLARGIEAEVKEHGTLLSTMEETMERAQMALKRATMRLNTAYKQAKSNHLLYLVLFMFVLFFGVYMLARMYRLKKIVIG